MTCWYWHRRLSDYLDEELAPASRRRLQAHLSRCAAARALLAELAELKAATRALEHPELPAGSWARLGARLAAAPAAPPQPAVSVVRVRIAALAVAGAAFLLVAAQAAYRTPLQRHLLAELRAAERAAAPPARVLPALALDRPYQGELLRGRLEVERAVRSARRALLAHPNHPAAKRSYVRALRQRALLSELQLI